MPTEFYAAGWEAHLIPCGEFVSVGKQKIVADTVINHTTGVDKTQGTGTAGSPYDNKGDFPEAGYAR